MIFDLGIYFKSLYKHGKAYRKKYMHVFLHSLTCKVNRLFIFTSFACDMHVCHIVCVGR